MKLIVLTPEPISAQQLRDALASGVDPAEAEVMVVVPALHESALRFWLSDADEAIAKATAVSQETVDRLGDAGVAASSDTGEGDPLEALEDALSSFQADRIVIFDHPEGEKRYREELDHEDLKRRFGLPVDRAELPAAPGS